MEGRFGFRFYWFLYIGVIVGWYMCDNDDIVGFKKVSGTGVWVRESEVDGMCVVEYIGDDYDFREEGDW